VQAVVITPEHRLAVAKRPDPVPGPREVLVRVHAAGVNRADLLQAAGRYPPPAGAPPDIPGLEFAGEVVARGAGTSLPVGARVFGLVGGGAQAELLPVHEEHCAPVPDGLEWAAAGAVPEAFVTSHDALVTIAALGHGEVVLVHAAASGVGTATVQLAHALGARVVGTSRTEEKLEQCRALGLDHAVVVPRELDVEALADRIVAAAGPVDVTIELVGGDYLRADVAAAAAGGRIVLVGTLAGGRSELDMTTAMGKRLRITGTMLRNRSVPEKAAAIAAFAHDVVPLLASGAVAPVVARTVPFGDAQEAYDLVARDAVLGKVVLTPG
jgi:NADPH2:quinone reductase